MKIRKEMKAVIMVLFISVFFVACTNEAPSAIDNEVVDTQSDANTGGTTEEEDKAVEEDIQDNETIPETETREYQGIMSYYNKDYDYSMMISERFMIDEWAGDIYLSETAMDELYENHIYYTIYGDQQDSIGTQVVEKLVGIGVMTEKNYQVYQEDTEYVRLPLVETVNNIGNYKIVTTSETLDRVYMYPIFHTDGALLESNIKGGRQESKTIEEAKAKAVIEAVVEKTDSDSLLHFEIEDYGVVIHLPKAMLTQETIGRLGIETQSQFEETSKMHYEFVLDYTTDGGTVQRLIDVAVVDKGYEMTEGQEVLYETKDYLVIGTEDETGNGDNIDMGNMSDIVTVEE